MRARRELQEFSKGEKAWHEFVEDLIYIGAKRHKKKKMVSSCKKNYP